MHWKRYGGPLLLIVLSGCGGVAATELEGEANLVALRRCASDGECTLAPNDCCGCARGGEDLAVRLDALGALAVRFDCANAVCSAQANPKCSALGAKCMSGMCVMSSNQ